MTESEWLTCDDPQRMGVLKAVTGLTRSRVARAQLEHDSAGGEGRGLTASTDSAEADQPGHVRIATGGRISIHKRHADDGVPAARRSRELLGDLVPRDTADSVSIVAGRWVELLASVAVTGLWLGDGRTGGVGIRPRGQQSEVEVTRERE